APSTTTHSRLSRPKPNERHRADFAAGCEAAAGPPARRLWRGCPFMFDFGVGYTDSLVIAVVALLVVGPKDLPKLLRRLGRFTASVRRMAAEFQRHLDEVAREADVDKVTSEIREATRFDLGEADMRKAAADLRSGLENTAPAADPHSQPARTPTAT